MQSKAVFFDRDGVINRDTGYVGSIQAFEFLPGVAATLGKLKALGCRLILVTNQSGIARGLYSESDFWQVTEYMQRELSRYEAAFDAVYFCPHHPEARVLTYRKICTCRKPQPGLFLKALQDLKLSGTECAAVGDQPRDLLAAHKAGIERLFLLGDQPDASLQSLDYRLLSKISELPELLEKEV